MGENLNYTSQQKMEFLKNRIFNTIMSGEDLTKADFDDLKRKIPEYAMLKLGVEDISLSYANLGKDIRGEAGESSVILNNEYFTFQGKPETYSNDMKLLVTLFNTATHEFSHIIDGRNIKETNADREMNIANIYGVSAISGKYEEGSKEYEKVIDFMKAFYYSSRSEVFARKSAILHSKAFLNELMEYKKEQHPETPEIKNEINAFFDAVAKISKGEEAVIPKLSPEAKKYTNATRNELVMQNYLEDIEYDQDITLEYALQEKGQNFDAMKQDFETSLEKFLDPKCIDLQYANIDTMGAAKLMSFKEFFNEELAKKLYKHSIENGNWATALTLAKHEELNVSPKEIQRLSNEIDTLVVNHQTYQQPQVHNPEKQEFSMQ